MYESPRMRRFVQFGGVWKARRIRLSAGPAGRRNVRHRSEGGGACNTPHRWRTSLGCVKLRVMSGQRGYGDHVDVSCGVPRAIQRGRPVE
eukprot:665796-Pleurochrysis_carterae.AAC.1